MDYRIVLILLIVLVSGCVEDDKTGSSGDGLVVEEFTVSDEKLRPGQTFSVELILRNDYHEKVNLQKVNLHSTGFLEVNENGLDKVCSKSSLEPVEQGIVDKVECVWTVETPEEIDFETRKVSFNAYAEYRTALSNANNPIPVDFVEEGEPANYESFTSEFSNSDISMEIEATQPSFAGGDEIFVEVTPSGREPLSPYSISAEPGNSVQCPGEVEKLIEGGAEFECEINAGTDTGTKVTRQISLTISYLYGRTLSKTVEVVS